MSWTLNNRAIVAAKLGAYEKAAAMWEQALEIKGHLFGDDDVDYASTLTNLALLHDTQGDKDKAEDEYKRCLAIEEKLPDKDQRAQYAKLLNNLGMLYRDNGMLEKAKPLYEESLRIKRKSIGSNHESYAGTLRNLAKLYVDLKEYDKAEALLEEALQKIEKAFGEDHPIYAEALSNTAEMYEQASKYQAAECFWIRMMRTHSRTIRLYLNSLPELQRVWCLRKASFDIQYSLQLLQKSEAISERLQESEFIAACFGNVAGRKGLAYEEAATSGVEELDALRRAYADAVFSGQSSTVTQHLKKAMEQFEIDRYDSGTIGSKDLVEISAAIQHKIPQNSILIDIICYQHDKPSYGVFVVQKALLDFFSIDKSWADERVVAIRDEKFLKGLMRKSNSHRTMCALQELSDAILGRALKDLGPDTSTVVFSPDGEFARLPIGILPYDGASLMESKIVYYVGASRDLLSYRHAEISNSPAIFANPNFEMRTKPATTDDTHQARAELHRGGVPIIKDPHEVNEEPHRHWQFQALPGTAEEACIVKAALQRQFSSVQLYQGDEATCTELIKLQHPAVLHIATHGFFEPEDEDIGLSRDKDKLQEALKVATQREMEDHHPMLRCGLALAGAQAWQDGQACVDRGIVTALELRGLDLKGTDLVVLSACGTGLGVRPAGVGVIGLGRALTNAGANAVLMSLWDIADNKTTTFMSWFYEAYLGGKTEAEALCVAQRRAIGLRTEGWRPWHWAAFIVQYSSGE